MRFLTFTLIGLLGTACYGQINDFRGTVTDKLTGEKLENATITIAGSERVFVSRGEGLFTIPGSLEGKTAEISMIGYGMVDFKLEKGQSFDIALERDVFNLPLMNLAEKKYDGPEEFMGTPSGKYESNAKERQMMGGEGADVFQLPAEFPGGWQNLYAYIYHTFDYPEEAIAAKQRGALYIGFTINEEGKVEDLTLIEGEGENGMKEEIFDIFQEMPRWYPAIQNKRPARQWFMVTLPFVAK